MEIDWSPLRNDVADSLAATYGESAAATAKDLGSSFLRSNERAAEYARERAADLVKDVEETTRDRIRSAESRAFTEGMTPSQLAKEIDEIIDDPARAKMIAETEIAKAQMNSALDAATDSGLVQKKRSLLSNDHADEDICDDCANAGDIPIDEEFPSGEVMPPHHPRCWCDAVMILGE